MTGYLGDRGSEGRGVADRDEPAGLPIGQDVVDSSGVGRNDRQARTHRFEHCSWQSLPPGSESERVGRGDYVGYVMAKSEELHSTVDLMPQCGFADVTSQRPIADQHESEA